MKLKQRLNNIAYQNLVRPICFTQDEEKVHNFFIKFGKILQQNKLNKKAVAFMFDYQNKMLEQEISGIKFRNPVGLSAGFDKNAELIDLMAYVGFGFEEAGSITCNPSPGNPGKRLWRVPESKSIVVNMGLNNYGSREISSRLNGKKFPIPFGVSIARTNCRETVKTEEGIKDYANSFRTLANVGDYFALNISCPNAYGGQPFSDPVKYEMLLKALSRLDIKKPVFVKMSPDLSDGNVDEIISLSKKYKFIRGFICSNLTKEQNEVGKGGTSGKTVEFKADRLLSYIYRKTRGEFVLIGVGGIFSAEDAYKKIKLGANLVELITGMIYQGPSLISEINEGLVELLKKDGYTHVSQAVGKDIK